MQRLLAGSLQQSLIHTQQGLVHLSEKNHLSLLKFVDSCFVFFAQILGCHEYRLHDLTAHLYLRFFHALPQSLIHVKFLPVSLQQGLAIWGTYLGCPSWGVQNF